MVGKGRGEAGVKGGCTDGVVSQDADQQKHRITVICTGAFCP
jgi:hypothetical protein